MKTTVLGSSPFFWCHYGVGGQCDTQEARRKSDNTQKVSPLQTLAWTPPPWRCSHAISARIKPAVTRMLCREHQRRESLMKTPRQKKERNPSGENCVILFFPVSQRSKCTQLQRSKGGREEMNSSKHQHLCGPGGHVCRTRKGLRSRARSAVMFDIP